MLIERITLLEIALISPMIITLGWAIPNLLAFRKKGPSIKMMGLFMLNMFLFFLATASFYFTSYRFFIFLDPVFMFSLASIFPILYLYLRLVINPRLKLSARSIVQFIPSLFFMVSAAFVYAFVLSSADRSYYVTTCLAVGCDWKGNIRWIQMLNLSNKVFFTFQAVLYLFLFIRLIRAYSLQLKNLYSNLENLRIRWKNLFFSFYILSVLVGIPAVFGGHETFRSNETTMIISFFILSFILYALAWVENSKFFVSAIEISTAPDARAPNVDMQKLKEELISYFRLKKPYLNADLKLEDVQTALNSNRTYISRLINQEYKTNFCMFVNRFRVAEAKKLLVKEAYKNYSNEHIGKLAGFGNYHSFIQAFRYFENTTPSKYRKIKV